MDLREPLFIVQLSMLFWALRAQFSKTCDTRFQNLLYFPGSIDTDMSSVLPQDKTTFMKASDVANKIIDIGTDSSSVYH